MNTFFKKSWLEMRAMKKGTFFVAFFMLLMVGACKGSEMQAGAEWLREPDLDDVQNEQYLDIPNTDIYEVTASKVDIALMELEQTSISKLSPELATWYTGHYYTCPEDKQPYLVRAVYGHAGTGAFSLKRLDDDLLIVHRSLGHSTIYQKTALVVNLDYEPDQIYIRATIAE
jgi:hypothetical protein